MFDFQDSIVHFLTVKGVQRFELLFLQPLDWTLQYSS